jgi:sensor histidine kinase YesM
MKKIFLLKKPGIRTLHLLFWLVSFNVWYFVFNPGVESTGLIKGVDDSWHLLVLFNSLSFLYCLLPLTWFRKPIPLWLKITSGLIFCVPLLFLIFEQLLPVAEREDLSLFTDLFVTGFLYVFVFHLTIIGAVYYNLRTLIPRYLSQSRFGSYLFRVCLLTLSTAIVNFTLYNFVIDQLFPSLFFISYFKIWEIILVVVIYLLLTTLVFLVWQYAVLLMANRDKVQHELSTLKAQINPHFLFNNLNTIYGLTTTDVDHSRNIILKLSDFLRYVLYDTEADSILLEKEIEIIKTYVDLQKERIDPAITRVSFTPSGDFSKVNVSPLLLLPLTENCFKHGVGNYSGEISIDIRFDDKVLVFSTMNPVSPRDNALQGEKGGLGIKNMEKRLNLLYPGRYSLKLEEKEGYFRAELRLEVH